MNKQLFFSGKQIKNYLIGFGSIFADIPYTNSKGMVKNVPIHYGSPSDVLSFLESNVDNVETKNVNRLKDLTIPLFSFRIAGIERNLEKRKDPLTTRTRDLRKSGYNTAYTTMTPAPIIFTMELVLWASSDYQCFEILEQIIPYFNSPQQITIEQLPDIQSKTSEVSLTSIELDTEPSSQKYSAQSILTFNMSGWLITQPKIWTTNLAFELSILDDAKTEIFNSGNNTRSVEFIDCADLYTPPSNESHYNTLESFILNTNLKHKYTLDLLIFKYMLSEGIIDSAYNIIKSCEFIFAYDGDIIHPQIEITITYDKMLHIIASIKEVENLLQNQELYNYLKANNYEEIIKLFLNIDYYDIDITNILILIDKEYLTTSFNKITDIPANEKMIMFGSLSYNIDNSIQKMRMILSGLQFIHTNSFKINLSEPELHYIFSDLSIIEMDKVIISFLLSLEFSSLDVSEIKENSIFKIFSNKYNITFEEYEQLKDYFDYFLNYIENGE